MTVLFSETFSGSGDLHGKLPDIADPGANTWVSADVDAYERKIVLADGYAVSSATGPVEPATKETSASYASIPLSGFAQLAEFTFSFDVMTGGSVALGAGQRSPWTVMIDGMLDTEGMTFHASMRGNVGTGWILEVNANGSVFADVELSFLPETLYPCNIHFAAGDCTFNGFGQVLSLTGVGGTESTFSTDGIGLYLGLNARLDCMSISAPATDPKIIAAAPPVLAAPAVLVAWPVFASAATDSMLSAAGVLAMIGTKSIAAAPSMLQPPSVLAVIESIPSAISAAPSMLRAVAVLAVHDFTGQIGDVVTFFVMDLITPTGTVRIPISSWQATLQTGSSNYVQCVIPACTVWASAINSATEFAIYRRAVLPDDSAIEYEMARAPAGQLQFDRGPERHTCTLSGYSDAFAASEDPPATYDRALTGVRSISSGSSYRVRCAVDWLLRPGHRAFVEGAPFVVKFINYYAPSGFDSYMDVGG